MLTALTFDIQGSCDDTLRTRISIPSARLKVESFLFFSQYLSIESSSTNNNSEEKQSTSRIFRNFSVLKLLVSRNADEIQHTTNFGDAFYKF